MKTILSCNECGFAVHEDDDNDVRKFKQHMYDHRRIVSANREVSYTVFLIKEEK